MLLFLAQGGDHQPLRRVRRQGEQGLPVPPPRLRGQLPRRRLVAGELTPPGHLPAEHRHEGIEPVEAGHHRRTPLIEEVPAAQVGELVAEDILQPPPVLHPLGQKYGGPQQSHGHGTGNGRTHRQGDLPAGVQLLQHLQRQPAGGVALPPDQPGKTAVAPAVPAQAEGKAQRPEAEPQRRGGEHGPPVHREDDGGFRLPSIGGCRRLYGGRGLSPLVRGGLGGQGRRALAGHHHGSNNGGALRLDGYGQVHPHRHAQPQQHQQPQVVPRRPADAAAQQVEHPHEDHPQHRAQQAQPQQGEKKAGHASSPLSSHSLSKRSLSSATSSRSSCRRSTRAATRSLALPS